MAWQWRSSRQHWHLPLSPSYLPFYLPPQPCRRPHRHAADFPYDAPAKSEVGWAFWWLTLALFCVFLLMFAARFAFFPRDAMRLFDEPFQAMFLGAIPPSLSVIVNGFPT